MTSLARMAYANARARALRSTVLGSSLAAALRQGATIAQRLGTLRPHGIEARDGAEVVRALVARLARTCATLERAYPVGGELLHSFVELHELENLRLAWRAVSAGIGPERWTPLWRPLAPAARLDRDAAARATTRPALVELLRDTPYWPLEPLLARGIGLAVELGIDKWGTLRLVQGARALPRRERAASDLALLLARERDLRTIGRAGGTYRLPPEIALGALGLLPEESTVARLRALYEAPAEVDAALRLVRQERREACARALRGNPLSLAPGVAILLLLDAQIAAVAALVEAGDAEGLQSACSRAVAASWLGAP